VGVSSFLAGSNTWEEWGRTMCQTDPHIIRIRQSGNTQTLQRTLPFTYSLHDGP